MSWFAGAAAPPGPSGSVAQRLLAERFGDPWRRASAAEVAAVAASAFPADWPFLPADFERQDGRDDAIFYRQLGYDATTRVHHIDEGSRAALTKYYEQAIPDGARVVDVAASWVSHLPPAARYASVVGVGMLAAELGANERLTAFHVKDLNRDPRLDMLGDCSVDALCVVVSTDYFARPRELFADVLRVLAPGGRVILSQSNRCFPNKTVALWGETNDAGHCWILAAYLKYTGFSEITTESLATSGEDPMFVVSGVKPPPKAEL